ncbi:6-deoxy-6-sulfogluconolactonase [Roseobacter fucihabitans]|uniref:6-deoxy-6-sulfogluconolactonase n=1 Tax=Roseobacter fucihabitans TaxID=1537242 RepID=A0ABZ2BTY2_9RHOB|nr:SMP-30/gluconolactonase/LRE family protein [Roseobacter litoralis]MBC6964387.1 L-arabinolactonase [Roseobacter litoralis]
MTPAPFDTRRCQLGEGPLWHPIRKQLFWFDITGHRLLSQNAGIPLEWHFDEPVSAAGWIDEDNLLVASATGLWRFNLNEGDKTLIEPLEGSNPETRSNDGRADPWGGFWIGTMGLNAQPGAGAIYRFYRGEIRRLFDAITIPNAICFAPDRTLAYFTDTADARLMTAPLDREGWPAGTPSVLIDFRTDKLNPDGAVVDQNGALWIAQWGAARVAVYSHEGVFQHSLPIPPTQTTCPAFGGEDMTTLFVTTAMQGIDPERLRLEHWHGQTFAIPGAGAGIAEPQVLL